jgi:hypothetical protein
MDYQSPRFQGNADLLNILNDPDTGTQKLGPGSPPEAVARLQQALFDLAWTLRIDPPFEDESQFVIGIFGPVTTRTVLAYKTHYDLRFPPDDPNGFIDGFAGPRTMQRLDPQCVLHDASHVAIELKAEELRAEGIDVVLDSTTPTTQPILGTSGVRRRATLGPELAAFWHTAETGAHMVHGPIVEKYVELEHAHGRLGFPVTDVFNDDPFTLRCDFEHGLIKHFPGTGVTEVVPPA